jgi:hypothetical protein
MTDAATTASAPIAPILNWRLAPDRRLTWLPDIRISLSSAYAGGNGSRKLRPERLRVAYVHHSAVLC